MAKTTAKTSPKAGATLRIRAQDDDEPITPSETQEGEDEGETEETVSIIKTEEPTVEKSGDDIVQFVCYEEVDPAPVVGNYKFRDHNVLKLEKTKTYSMPRDVAMHLVDRKKGSIISA